MGSLCVIKEININMNRFLLLVLQIILATLNLSSCFTAPSALKQLKTPLTHSTNNLDTSALNMGAESEVSFDTLDGTKLRIGIIKTRWNSIHVSNLVSGIKEGLKECNVTNIFETEVPGSFELPYAARLLALSGTVDAIICTGVLIKGETYHFEYICDAVSTGIMNVGLQTMTPVIFGVLTCLNEEQVISRSCGDNNHGVSWGKTAVEMALLRRDAFGGKKKGSMGFGNLVKVDGSSEDTGKKNGFF